MSLKLKGLFAIMLVALAIGFHCQASAAQTWQHPGVLVSQAQLDFIKQQVNLKVEPFYQQFLDAQKSGYGSLTYTVKGPYPGGVTQCGSYSSPDYGCSDEDSDSAAAYVQALLWYITGNQTYATNAINILNAYGHGLVGFAGFTPGYPCPGAVKTCDNGPLQAAWDATKWPRAAEIIRYGNGGSAGWAPADIAAFSNMLKTVYEPMIYNGSTDNGNWELSMIEGMMGIAVFNEDLTLLNHAQLFWSQRVPAYFYYQPIDGDQQPPFPPGRQAYTTWNGQLIFNTLTSGVAQETCRDLKHTEDGIASSIDAAETDHIQSQGGYGVKLYESQQDRLVQSLNLMAGLESSASTVAPTDFCTGSKDKIELGIGTTYVIGYNEYHNRLNDPNMQDASGTTGLNGTSNTYTWIQNGLLPQTIYSDGGVHMAIFEALTHYANAPSSAGFGLSLSPATQTVAPNSTASYTVTVSPWDGYSGNVALSIANSLPAGVSASFNPATISGGSGTSTLTVTTGSGTPVGSYTLQVAGADGTLTHTTSATLAVVSSANTATITAINQTITSGQSIPTLTYTLTPSLTLTTKPTCATKATSGSAPGTYPITCSGAVLSGYAFTYVPGTLTVVSSTSAMTITATNQTVAYGSSIPTLKYTKSPSVSLTTDPTCVTTATSSSLPGAYPITCSGAARAGYVFTYVAGTLTITPLAVTITAKDQHMKPGESVPALVYEVKPSTAVLTVDPTCTTTATPQSPLGTYPIICSGATGTGYTFTYVAGTMTVKD
jgi:hypothetical protein